MKPVDPSRSALVVAHPGHELRVHAWLADARPSVFVLTDGSGHTSGPRLASTTRVLRAAGARPGGVYGRFTDAALYAALLGRDEDVFLRLAEELAGAFVRCGVEEVVGDAREGYNPAHDVCRVVLDAAAALAGAESARPLRVYEFPLMGRPDNCPEGLRHRALWLRLDESEVARKLAAARGYPELAEEVNAALAASGEDAFRFECLRPVNRWDGEWFAGAEPPFYERHGERRVHEGHYRQVVRCRDHVAPLAERLWRFTEGARRAGFVPA
ncbi:MAG: hypothetical protein U0797_05415 [Gemmataceae bacterium]